MKIIGIIGYAGVGKDTVAQEIKKHTTRHVYITHFADVLKEIAYQYGWDGKKDKRGRKFLQTVGDICRTYNPDYFINHVRDDLEKAVLDTVLIADVRYQAEAEMIKDCNGLLVVVKRTTHLSFWDKVKSIFLPRHSSEKYHKWIKKYPDAIVLKNCTVEEIPEKLKQHKYLKKLLDK